MSIEVIEISSSDEDGEEEFEEKVTIKVMANRSTRRASSAAEQYSSWRSRRVAKPWEEDEDEDEEDEEEDDDDDCFILPDNPFLGDQLRRLTLDTPPPPDDVAIIAERGKVACRDYPHSRHLCANYPFSKTPHKSHCQKCYCYVCDEPAPCDCWEKHCKASDKDSSWNEMRRKCREARQKVKAES